MIEPVAPEKVIVELTALSTVLALPTLIVLPTVTLASVWT